MSWLRREHAPLAGRVWDAIDAAAVEAAKQEMAARRIADFVGPKGWEYAAETLGTTRPASPAQSGAARAVLNAILMVELRADFAMPWSAIDAYARGARVLDTKPAEHAGRTVALAEDELAFRGSDSGSGFLTGGASPRLPLGDWSDARQVAGDLLAAVSRLDAGGIPGPYAVVLAPDRYYAYLRAAAERRLSTEADRLEGTFRGIHRSPVIEGGAVFSLRGGDALLVVGGDLSVGYRSHDRDAVHLFCAETIGAHLLGPEAVCVLG
jgi:uncharacterized linocin/CFP29 family protein